MQIIFLMGKQRSGKDTVADFLQAEYGFRKLSLATPVKEIAKDLFGMKGKNRGLLIQIGMKMREIDPDVWVKNLWRSLVTYGDDRFVIPDVRFPNEYKFFKERGGVPIRVYAPLEDRMLRPGYDVEFENDPTETALEDEHEFPARFIIPNFDTIDQLKARVDAVMRELGVEKHEAL